MSRQHIKEYNHLRELLWFAYGIRDRDIRIRAVGNIQARLAELVA